MEWEHVFASLGVIVAARGELIAYGATSRSLTAAVRFGHLVRLRRDHYVLPNAAVDLRQAVRIGGAVTCVSALKLHDVFAFDTSLTHVALPSTMSRLRSPTRNPGRFRPDDRGRAALHWWPCRMEGEAREVVDLVDAVAHAIRCQPRELAIASIDNVLHQGLLTMTDIEEIFAGLPDRFRAYVAGIDRRAEAGQETVLRLLAKSDGYRVELQRYFPGVGRVDILVEDCVVLEADSRTHHDGWEKHVRDRGRDIALAKLGYPSLRPAFQHTMYHPDEVRAAIRGLVTATKRDRTD